MKKNILLVPSLLALSLVVTTPASGMEIQYKEKPTSQGNRKQRRQAKQQKIQNIQRQIVEDNEHYQIEQAVDVDFEIFDNPLYNSEAYIPSNLVQSETEIINIALPERVAQDNALLITQLPTVLETQNNQKPYRTYEVQQIKTTAQTTSDHPEARKNHVFAYAQTDVIEESDLYQERTKIENSPVLDIQKEDIVKLTPIHSSKEIAKITPKSYISAEDLQKSPLYNRHNLTKTSDVIELPTIVLEATNISTTTAENYTAQPEVVAEETTSTLLFQSVALPTEKKELNYWARLNAGLANLGVVSFISNIKSFLQNGTYDVENAEYLEMLHNALTQAHEANDFDTIIKIAELCQSTEDYKDRIRINDNVAASVLELLTNKYNAAIASSNLKINSAYDAYTRQYDETTVAFVYTMNQAATAYLKNIKEISDKAATQYPIMQKEEQSRIKAISESIAKVGNLNGSTRPKIKALLEQNIQIKENKIAEQFAQSDEQLKSLLELSEKMPKINLQLTNK